MNPYCNAQQDSGVPPGTVQSRGVNGSIDILKCAAAFTIVLLHTVYNTGELPSDIDSMPWLTRNFYDALSRWAVPVFFMISGFLLLDDSKKEPLGVFYSKRASRVMIPLIFWSLFYSVWTLLESHGTQDTRVSLMEAGRNILRGTPYYHLWFLYTLVGLYVFVPFIRKSVCALSSREVTILCVLFLACSTAMSVTSYLSAFKGGGAVVWMRFPKYLAYFVLGYQLPRLTRLMMVDRRVSAAMFCVGVLSTAAGCYLFSKYTNIWFGKYFYDNFSPTTILAALSIFIFFQQRGNSPAQSRIVPFLAPTMLGVYLIHPAILQVLKALWHYGAHQEWYALPSLAIVAYLLSVIITKTLQNTPVCRRLV